MLTGIGVGGIDLQRSLNLLDRLVELALTRQGAAEHIMGARVVRADRHGPLGVNSCLTDVAAIKKCVGEIPLGCATVRINVHGAMKCPIASSILPVATSAIPRRLTALASVGWTDR